MAEHTHMSVPWRTFQKVKILLLLRNYRENHEFASGTQGSWAQFKARLHDETVRHLLNSNFIRHNCPRMVSHDCFMAQLLVGGSKDLVVVAQFGTDINRCARDLAK